MEATTVIARAVVVPVAKKKIKRYKPKMVRRVTGPGEEENVLGPKRIARKIDIDALQIEKGFLYPSISVREYLIRVKEFTPNQYSKFMDWAPLPEWDQKREQLQNAITSELLKRHVDAAAEVQDVFLKTTKLGVARVLELLSKTPVTDRPEYVMVTDPDVAPTMAPRQSKVKRYSLRSVDLMNCMQALKIAQEIYRKAMGITDESDSIAAVIEQMSGLAGITLNQVNIHSTTIHSKLSDKAREKIAALDYDGIEAMIAEKRKLKVINGNSLGDVIIHEGVDED